MCVIWVDIEFVVLIGIFRGILRIGGNCGYVGWYEVGELGLVLY